MEVRLPTQDGPRTVTVAAVGVVCFGLGLALAAWGMDAEPESDAQGTSSLDRGADAAGAGRDPEGSGSEDSEPEDSEPTNTPGEDPVGTDSAATEAPEHRGPDAPAAGDVPTPGSEIPADEPPGATPVAPDPAGAIAEAPTTFVRGRVAYLRCDGVDRRGRCPRDEPLEQAVWLALSSLPSCAAPPSAAGEADLRLAWDGDGPADVLWRDTFADDVIRLDRDRVLACVEQRLMETRASLPTSRLLISFRFRLE